MSARLIPFRVHVADQVLAALGEAGTPLSTAQIEERTGYGKRHGQLAYQVLNSLAVAGLVKRVNPGARPGYWQRTAPPAALPVITETTGEDA